MFEIQTNNQIERVLNSSLSKLKNMINTSTVVGEAIKMQDGSTLIPIMRVTMGYVAGGGEYNETQKKSKQNLDPAFAGGSGACISMNPVGFMFCKNGETNFVSINEDTKAEKLIEVATSFLSKVVKNEKK